MVKKLEIRLHLWDSNPKPFAFQASRDRFIISTVLCAYLTTVRARARAIYMSCVITMGTFPCGSTGRPLDRCRKAV